ncbi:MAG: hypothetical protein RR276_02815 [Angelakisella sp.]
MSKAKRIFSRVAAVALSAVMTVTMLSGLATVTAQAADPTISSVTATPAEFAVGDSVTLSFWVKDISNGIGTDKVTTSAAIGLSSITGDFTAGSATGKVSEVKTMGGVTDIASYKVQITGLTAQKASTERTTLGGITVADTPKYNQTLNGIALAARTVSTPDSKPSDTRYSLTKVAGSSYDSATKTYKPGRVYYDIEDFTSSSDASIRQTYFADLVVRITDPNAPADLTGTDIVAAATQKQEMGSFLYDTASGSSVAVTAEAGFYEVRLKNLRYSGNGKKLSFRVKKDNFLNNLSFDIGECFTRQEAQTENNNNNKPDDSPKIDGETPYVIVSKYNYGGEKSVTAGETFTMSLTFYNTSVTETIDNMMITITMPDALMLTSSSNTFYIPALEKQASITKSVQVTAKVDAKPMSHNVGVSMKYQYIDHKAEVRRSAETTENIAIPVVQVDRFQLTSVEVPPEIALEEESSVTVSFVNKGRSEVYNVSVQIDGNIKNPGQNQNLGNLASGATGTADFYIKPNEAGTVSGNITVTYEDTNMEEKTATIQYNATVKTLEEMSGGGMNGGMIGGMMPGMGEPEVPPEPVKKPMWPVFVIIGVAVLIPVAIIIIRRIRKKRREREDADL